MIDQERDVLGTLPERGHGEGHDVESQVEPVADRPVEDGTLHSCWNDVIEAPRNDVERRCLHPTR